MTHLMAIQKVLILGLAAMASATAIPRQFNSSTINSCRVLPGDRGWPIAADWNNLNKTVNGRLIASVPWTSVCHEAPFNDYSISTCDAIRETWNQTTLKHIDQPAEFLNMYVKNYTCDAFTPQSQPCELGNYASYIIDVRSAADVQAGIKFARRNNIRLVIKNTGHDYLGKSTGKGGLSLWTHNLKSSQYIPRYKSPYYNGPAIKIGAGTQGYEAYAAANITGHRIVGGTCPTVGIAGGYSQGGGHSMLSSMYGLGADNVLEWEVVTVDGRHLVATPTQNSDLYWAMSGGGPGTFAVALSMTSRLHKDSIVGGASISFNDTKVGNDAFWEAIGAFHTLLPPFVDAGNSFTYGLSKNIFSSWGVTMPGADLDRVNALLKPFLDDLTERGIDYEYVPRVSPNFYEHFDYYLGPMPQGSTDYNPFTGSRIIPRSVLLDAKQGPVAIDALRNATMADGYAAIPCQSFNLRNHRHPDNAVLPAWRDGLTICLTSGAWDPDATPAEMAARQNFAANELQPMLDRATPGGGVYMNEANFMQQNWQREFYGSNYRRLLGVKHKYDPESMLYARTAVGSEAWAENGDGRLCRA